VQRRPEPPENVGQLVIGVRPAHESGPAQRPTHQEPAVSAEQDPLLAPGPLDELIIVSGRVVRRVDAEQAKPACQRAEVYVQQEEGWSLQWLWTGSDADGDLGLFR
jgi:hypothetical protein